MLLSKVLSLALLIAGSITTLSTVSAAQQVSSDASDTVTRKMAELGSNSNANFFSPQVSPQGRRHSYLYPNQSPKCHDKIANAFLYYPVGLDGQHQRSM